MARQTRPGNSRVSAGGNEDFNVIFMGKKTKETLAQRAGNPEFANLSPRARSLWRSSQEHYNPEAVKRVLKEVLLRREFTAKEMIDGYSIETIPFDMRGELKEKLWKEHTNYKGEEGKWSPTLLGMKVQLDDQYWKRTKEYVYDRSMDDFDQTAGLLGRLAVYNPPVDTVVADLTNPEFVRLIELHDNDPITPLVSGKTGAGKSNFVLHTFRMSAIHNRGYINPAYGIRSRVRAYLPNFDGSEDSKLKSGVFPGIPSSYSYRFPWQIFMDEPKGSSILWTKYDWSMAQEEDLDDSPGIFSMVYLGEIGLGKLKYAGSKEVVLYKNLFQLTRQMRVRYYISSADPEPMPISAMEDFINPQVWINITPSGGRTGSAEYISTGPSGQPSVDKRKIGSIPLDPLTKIMGKGIASDMTATWEKFPLQQFLEYSRATNMNIYLKDPDTVMSNATYFVQDFQDRYIEEVYPDEADREETVTEIVTKPNMKNDIPKKEEKDQDIDDGMGME